MPRTTDTFTSLYLGYFPFVNTWICFWIVIRCFQVLFVFLLPFNFSSFCPNSNCKWASMEIQNFQSLQSLFSWMEFYRIHKHPTSHPLLLLFHLFKMWRTVEAVWEVWPILRVAIVKISKAETYKQSDLRIDHQR